MDFDFIPEGPCLWEGRYPRAAGADSVFHVALNSRGEWRPFINWLTEDGIGTCWMFGDDSPGALAAAVNAAKWFLGGSAGGSFLVNEFGQVIVPAQDFNGQTGRRAYVGEVSGHFMFHDPFAPTPSVLDLSDEDLYLPPGEDPDIPYVGALYNLSAGDEVYYWPGHHPKETPPTTNHGLISALRKLRPHGAVRFLINPEGVVLTKVPGGQWPETTWHTAYVGRLDYEYWFEKEEPSC